MIALIGSSATQAAKIKVMNADDRGRGSLRQAIADAKPGDEIRFHRGLDGVPVVLTSGPLVIDKDLTITGRGPSRTIVDGNAGGRVFYIRDSVVLLSDMTIRNGRASDLDAPWVVGGGVYADAVLTISGSVLRDNTTACFEDQTCMGGGVFNNGTLTVMDTVVSDNIAGGLVPFSSYAGGIFNNGALNLSGSSVTGNTVGNGNDGGGIFNNGVLTAIHSVISTNYAGYAGGIASNGTATFTRSTISNNHVGSWGCGGVANGGEFVADSCTVSGNRALDYGGGICNHDVMTLTNSTISGNAGDYSGGIDNSGTLALNNCTVTRNSAAYSFIGGGISGGTVTLNNSIIAHQASGFDCEAAIVSLGHNIDSDGSCNLTETTDVPDTDPLLGPLANNGGPTRTCALRPDSPAIDRGGSVCEPTDQRGLPRPVDGDRDGWPLCDIGAFEYSTSPTVLPDS